MSEKKKAPVSRRIRLKRGVAPESAYTARTSKEVQTDNQSVTVPIPSQEAIVAVLRRAREIIRRGWCRGYAWVDVDGRPSHFPEAGAPAAYSLACAVRTAADGKIAGEHALRTLRRLTGHHNLSEWNDHPLRVKRDVIDLLSLAVREHGGPMLRRGGWRLSGAE